MERGAASRALTETGIGECKLQSREESENRRHANTVRFVDTYSTPVVLGMQQTATAHTHLRDTTVHFQQSASKLKREAD